MMLRPALLAPVLLALASLAPVAAQADEAPAPAPTPVIAPEPTRVLDPASAQRLRANKGLTLQWLDWNTRGSVFLTDDNGVLRLRGAQAEAAGPGRLFLDGVVTEIGQGYFTFEGKIRITDTPDRGRTCEKDKTWHFAVTQGRSYYRLREFEWCDGLTDYVDIYF